MARTLSHASKRLLAEPSVCVRHCRIECRHEYAKKRKGGMRVSTRVFDMEDH